MTPLFSLLSPAGGRARLSVLIFHRVLPAPDPLFPEEVDAARFDAVCGWLRRWFRVLPLDAALRQLREGRLPARAAAITFDDGYADNHDLALPILQRHGLNATFFIATGYLDGGCMWNDALIDSVRHTRAATLDLRDADPALAGIAPLALDGPASRRAAAQALIRAVKYLPVAQRNAIVEQVRARAGVPADAGPMMRSAQVQALRRAGMVIGGHTVTHPILARLDAAGARAEISQGRERLEALLQERVGLFAYPNGRPGEDYSPETVQIARELGFDAALTTAWGAAGAQTDAFQIPRFSPWDRTRLRYGLRLARNLWQARA